MVRHSKALYTVPLFIAHLDPTNLVSDPGVRAMTRKEGDLATLAQRHKADIMCFQETKITEASLDEPTSKPLLHVPGFVSYWACSKAKKGYSGVATFAPHGFTLDASATLDQRFDDEGRVVRHRRRRR